MQVVPDVSCPDIQVLESKLKIFGYDQNAPDLNKMWYKVIKSYATSLVGIERGVVLENLVRAVVENLSNNILDFPKQIKSHLKTRQNEFKSLHENRNAKDTVAAVPAEANAKQVERLDRKGTIWHAVSKFERREGKESWEKVKAAINLMKDETSHVSSLVPWMRGEDRGFFGETPLHILLVFNDFNRYETRMELTQFFCDLWDMCPELQHLPYTEPLYKGENVLHIAIIKKVVPEVVEKMKTSDISWGRLLEGRATGEFFRNEELSESSCHALGETPLGFAACSCQPELFTYLLDSVDDVKEKQLLGMRTEQGGNNLLHLMVLNAFNRTEVDDDDEGDSEARNASSKGYRGRTRPGKDTAEKACMQMYDEIEKRMQSLGVLDALRAQPNKDGHTPLKLAAAEGSLGFFEFLLAKELSVAWTYGPVACSKLYLEDIDVPLGSERAAAGSPKNPGDLGEEKPEQRATASFTAQHLGSLGRLKAALTSIADRLGATPQLSVLELLVRHGRKDILTRSAIDKLVGLKWDKYGRRWFALRLARALAFTAAVVAITVVHHTSPWSGPLQAAGRVLATGLYAPDFVLAVWSVGGDAWRGREAAQAMLWNAAKACLRAARRLDLPDLQEHRRQPPTLRI